MQDQFPQHSSRTVRPPGATGAQPPPETGWLRFPADLAFDVSVKPRAYLPIYERLMYGLRDRNFTLLELGVWKGDSLAMWRDCFLGATIVGVDAFPPELDLGPRVTIVQGDQTDAELLARLSAEHAPQGFDVIIDDASHVGELSARSLAALYTRHLRPGGLYFIEDWGTGYLTDWIDGGAPEAVVGTAGIADTTAAPPAYGAGARRLPSHDLGMVGLVKRLVDHTAGGTLAAMVPGSVAEPLMIEWMLIHDGLVALKKPDS